jgi:DNA-binding CsgD family transcriptional regulator/sugar-specific transcriptional regulator TrmB
VTQSAEATIPAGAVVPSLVRWGVSADADLVYRTLVTFGPSETPAIARDLGLSAPRTREALEELAAAGAVRGNVIGPNGITGRWWRAAPPERVVASLRRRLLRVAANPPDLLDRFTQLMADAGIAPVPTTQQASGLIRALPSGPPIRERIVELVQVVRHEHISMHPEPAFTDDTLATASPLDRSMLSRGVKGHVVCLPAIDGDASSAYAGEVRKLRLTSRHAQVVPLKLMIFDRRTALVRTDPSSRDQPWLEVSDPALVSSLLTAFRREWAAGHDPVASGVPPIVLNAREEALIDLLTVGHTDESAARRLGISPRTVTYTMRALMDRLGVENRFQLGLALGARSARLPPASQLVVHRSEEAS